MDFTFLQTWDKRLERIENALSRIAQSNNEPKSEDTRFDMDGVIKYVPYPLAKSTLYSQCQSGQFPAHKLGKHWYFFKSEVDDFLKGGKNMSRLERLAASEKELTD